MKIFINVHFVTFKICIFVLKAVDGNWGPWNEWSEPTWKTNPDKVVRLRSCNAPAPKNGGKNCEGLNTDTKEVTRR